jgi:hypothetical protein
VKRNAPAHRNADGRDLFIADPNSGERRPPSATQAEILQSMNRRQFEISDVPMHAFS